jgi:hypothetical protein
MCLGVERRRRRRKRRRTGTENCYRTGLYQFSGIYVVDGKHCTRSLLTLY